MKSNSQYANSPEKKHVVIIRAPLIVLTSDPSQTAVIPIQAAIIKDNIFDIILLSPRLWAPRGPISLNPSQAETLATI